MTDAMNDTVLGIRTRYYVAPRLIALLIFSLAMAGSVIGALTSSTPDYARAAYSIWPALILGGWSVWLWLNQRPDYKTPLWKFTWLLGFVGYAVHFYFAMTNVFRWDILAVYDAQGVLVATANLLLLVVWFLSCVMAYLGITFAFLHRGAMLLFVASAAASTILFSRDPLSLIGGALIVALWVLALMVRRKVYRAT